MSSTPWIEKYRPRKISDVVHQEEVTQALQRSLGNENLPHLLFYGPPGTGKTSTILAAGKQLFGPEFYKSRVLELNASDERGINVIRSKVKEFAQLAVSTKIDTTSKYPVPPFKLIILDEADSMTRDAQAALRRTMEVYSKVTRFCLICNYVSRIIEPVASRCAKFRFKSLDRDLMMDRLKYIAEQEKINVEEGTFQTICEVSNGDLRRGITILQSTYRMYDIINSDNVREVAGLVPPEEITKFVRATATAHNFRDMQQLCKSFIRNAYPASQIIDQLHDDIAQNGSLNDIQKAKICIQLAQTEKALIDGADEYLQLQNLGAFIIRTCTPTKGRDEMIDV